VGPAARDREAVSRGRDAVTAQGEPSPAVPAEPFRASDDDDRNIARPTSSLSAVKVFWWTVLGLVIAGLVLSVAYHREGLVVGGIIILLVLPAIQLGAALITAVVLLALVPGVNQGYQFRQLGKIVLGLFVGTILGSLVMWGLFVVLRF
jgi:hypothetical protein